jgi:hypothetical protein
LRKRIQSILENRVARPLTAGPKALLAAVAVLAEVAPVGVGVVAQTEKPPAFEVASIRPVPPPRQGLFYVKAAPVSAANGISGNRLRLTMVSLRDLIATAYNIQDFQISGAPSWASGISAERYNIEAKGERDAPLTTPSVRLMLQS